MISFLFQLTMNDEFCLLEAKSTENTEIEKNIRYALKAFNKEVSQLQTFCGCITCLLCEGAFSHCVSHFGVYMLMCVCVCVCVCVRERERSQY